ncbi:type III pantothenate kinase [Maribacter polysaccharolyticus]|uniref:type III pantothenate kinase n=1 Tax=Maribacter polysaccharolyticus TaxID=3020831 RepID=UPI00237F6F3A|nr:type III pantothenate kinase [Maribacter polysaccharolyticus]MDE3742894.1 type III pantothenate kinase [Maribacter polysaccharolyticus]
MNLIIDVGNSFVKLAVFEKGTLVYEDSVKLVGLVDKARYIYGAYPEIEWTMVSSVVVLEKTDLEALKVFSKVHVLDHSTKTPFKNRYATPDTLGVDRIALAAAAFYHKPNKNVLVIDAGTCITYDLLTEEGEYLGGAISPGLQMRYNALHRQTSKLPLLTPGNPRGLMGNSTESSIHSGVINGVCAELDGIIDQYRTEFVDLTVILTGGDTQFLSKRLKNTIFALSNFLLTGLNNLLDYNKS